MSGVNRKDANRHTYEFGVQANVLDIYVVPPILTGYKLIEAQAIPVEAGKMPSLPSRISRYQIPYLSGSQKAASFCRISLTADSKDNSEEK